MYNSSSLIKNKNYMKYLKGFVFVIIILVGIFLFVFYEELKLESKNFIEDSVDEVEEKEDNINEEVDEEYWMVDIKGKIYNPGTYKVKQSMRVIDVILLAGGLLDDADTNNLNLSKKVDDQMVIIVYSKEEIEKLKEVPVLIENDALIKEESNEKRSKIISINTATLEELMQLKGIGEVKAKSIIKYREENGPFKSIDELVNVSGISDKTLAEIKDEIAI